MNLYGGINSQDDSEKKITERRLVLSYIRYIYVIYICILYVYKIHIIYMCFKVIVIYLFFIERS